MTQPKILDIIKRLIQVLKEVNSENFYDVYFSKQWFDLMDTHLPSLSIFTLEETPLEHKGNSFRHEQSIQIEGMSRELERVYLVANDVKRALLDQSLPFSITYQGYEIHLPDEGGSIIRFQLKFKVIYYEQL